MDGAARKGASAQQRLLGSLRRAGYLAVLAILFRLQLWIFAWPQSPWPDLFKVDILNSMALAVGLFSLMAAFRTEERIRLCAVLGVCIAVASPLVSQADWSAVHPFLRAYIIPDANSFGFFPWAAFVAFGMSAGSILRTVPLDQMHRSLQWGALLGFGLVLGAQYLASLPYSLYPKSDFWIDSPALTFIKLGVMLLLLAFAFLWHQQASVQSWSWLRLLGTNSLLIYWVHIELVYGRWFGRWKESLSVAETTAAAIALVLLMIGLAMLKTRWPDLRARFGNLFPAPSPTPSND
jgi:surface polysaccharide O-acyltransferase-like enzyme